MPPQALSFSFIIPVFNRPDEMDELLLSMVQQTDPTFEVIVVEDGSTISCHPIVLKYAHQLTIHYFEKANSGPGQTRNYGFERASGNYAIFLDSDCLLPPHYVETLRLELTNGYTDAFGGPDKAHPSFSNLQKAINYAMTSFFTTGGIRGSSEKAERFHPRSFNMGYSREVFLKTNGFAKIRFGEDIDMSIRIHKAGFTSRLIRNAYVYHKRRTKLRQFFKQVHNSGIARINLYKRHPESLKLVHTLPALFVLGLISIIIASFILHPYLLIAPLLLGVLLFFDALRLNSSIHVAGLAVIAGFVQLIGYGTGFIRAFFKRIILGKDEFSAFERNFYK